MPSIVNSTLQIPLSDIPTPLVFATPRQALSHDLAVYIHVGSTAECQVLIWDILNNIKSEIELIRRCEDWRSTFALPNLLYFCSRVTVVAYALGKAVLLTSPVDNCARLDRSLNIVLIVFIASTTLLFYIRVSALYGFNKYIMASFGVVWLATFAMTMTFIDVFYSENIGPTHYCFPEIRPRFLGPASTILLGYEILTYLAVTYRMYQLFHRIDQSSLKNKAKLVVFGTSLPALAKALLQQNQPYAFVIVLTKALLLVINYTVDGFDPPASVLFIISHLVIVNVLSSRIYRDLKLGHGIEDAIEAPHSGLIGDAETSQNIRNEPIRFWVSVANRSNSEASAFRLSHSQETLERAEKSDRPITSST